jgi:hypothetical protein
VDVKPLARLKRFTVDQNEVTLPVVIIAMSIPSLEMRISGTTDGATTISVHSGGKHRESEKVLEIELHIVLKRGKDVVAGVGEFTIEGLKWSRRQ